MDKDTFIKNAISFVLKSSETICPSRLGLQDRCDDSQTCAECRTEAFKEAGLWPEGGVE